MSLFEVNYTGQISVEAEIHKTLEQDLNDCILVFDFDGVISDKKEDLIYKLGFEESEKVVIERAVKFFNYPLSHSDFQYRRHLVYQAALKHLDQEILPGPVFDFLKTKSNNEVQTFILTARSGKFANQRLYEFLKQHRIQVSEIFHVGRVSKKLQLEILLRDFPDKNIIFFEDSNEQVTELLSHFNSNQNIKIVHIKYPDYGNEKLKEIRMEYLKTMESAFAKSINENQNLEIEKIALDHGVELFKFHALQRYQSIRYYFTVFGILLTGLSTIYSGSFNERETLGKTLSLILIILSVLFCALDKRNELLVNGDEKLLSEAEKRFAKRSGIMEFETILHSNKVQPEYLRYKKIMPIIFLIFFAIGIFAFITFCQSN